MDAPKGTRDCTEEAVLTMEKSHLSPVCARATEAALTWEEWGVLPVCLFRERLLSVLVPHVHWVPAPEVALHSSITRACDTLWALPGSGC